MNTLQFFEIQSSKPEREIAFYSAVFGWTFERVPGLPIPYFTINYEGVEGVLLERPAKVPPMGHGTNAYACLFLVKNFDQTEKLILANGGKVAMPKFAIRGLQWQGYFLDSDNNVFGLIQRDVNAS